jgi:hypothetical protein
LETQILLAGDLDLIEKGELGTMGPLLQLIWRRTIIEKGAPAGKLRLHLFY